MTEESLIYRLRKRAEIRRQISTRKSVQEGKPDRIADLLEEAAERIAELETMFREELEAIAADQSEEDNYTQKALNDLNAFSNKVDEIMDLSKCPNCGGPADNGHDRCIPPTPYFCGKCNKGNQSGQ